MELPVNKIAQSGLITLNLEDFLPDPAHIVGFDFKQYLFKELILKEKDFRAAMKAIDWSEFAQKYVAVFCSADAILPMWAYMLVSSLLRPYAQGVYAGTADAVRNTLLIEKINALDIQPYAGERIIIKGCGDKPLPADAFVAISARLQPVVKSLMYGEPCSTVPVYKQK